MVHKMLYVERCMTSRSHCYRVIDHHLSVGLSAVVYHLLNPPLRKEKSSDIRRVRMKNVMDEDIDRICRFKLLRKTFQWVNTMLREWVM